MSEDPDARRRAVRTSDSLPPAPRRQMWVEGLGDPDWRVRRESIDTVVTHIQGDPTMVHVLVDAIVQGDNVGLRNAALEALGRLDHLAASALRHRLSMLVGGERKFILEALGECGARDAIPDLVDLCEDPDPNVSVAAMDALARIGGSQAQRVLTARLGGSDPFLRMAALDGLVRSGAKLDWSELEPVLDDRFARRAAIPLLGRCGDEQAVPPLVHALDTSSPHVAARALVALSELLASVGLSSIREALTHESLVATRALLRDGDRETRIVAGVIALVARDAQALPGMLTSAAEDTLDPAAVAALRDWPGATEPMLEAAGRAIGEAKALGLELAAELGRHELRDTSEDEPLRTKIHAALIESLKSNVHLVAAASLRGLVWFAQPEDTRELVALATSSHESVRDAALGALEALAQREPDAVGLVLDETISDNFSPALPRLVARLRGDAAVGLLRAGLTAEAPELRQACLQALGDLGGDQAVDLVTLALTDEVASVQATAANVLRSLGAGSTALVHALQADDVAADVRVAIIGALADQDDAGAPHALANRLHDEEPQVVVAALDALHTLGAPDLATHVREALEHSHPEVVTRALRSVGTLDVTIAIDLTERLLVHDAWRVRAQAVRSLHELRGSAARSTLESLRDNEQDATVLDAIEALIRGDG